MERTVEFVLDAKAELGEGAIWDSRRRLLYWVDILRDQVHIFDPASGSDRSIPVGQHVGTVVPRAAGGLMLALHHGFSRLDPRTGAREIVSDPESHIATNRFNDGKCDPSGRFWAGTMDLDGRPGAGSLYRLDADGSVRRMLSDVSISNGIAWSLDCTTMYYIDTLSWELAAFDYCLQTGDIGNRRVIATFPRDMGHPDGMTIDAEGLLWVAMCGGGRVTRWEPDTGRMVDSIPLPATLVTSCAFGGPSLKELYLTTARTSLNEADLHAQPLAGGLFSVRPGVRGVPAFEFAG